LADNIGALQQCRNGGGLDRRRFLESHPLDGFQDLRRETEFSEELLLHVQLWHVPAQRSHDTA
jgi:hypothetical protein